MSLYINKSLFLNKSNNTLQGTAIEIPRQNVRVERKPSDETKDTDEPRFQYVVRKAVSADIFFNLPVLVTFDLIIEVLV